MIFVSFVPNRNATALGTNSKTHATYFHTDIKLFSNNGK